MELAASSARVVGDPVGDPVGELRRATEALLSDDPAALDPLSLSQRVVALRAEQCRLEVALAGLLAEWDVQGLWESDGSRSAAHRLARETRSSVRSSRPLMARARRLRHVAGAREAVVAGRLSIDHLDLLAHANSPQRRSLYERDEPHLVRQCIELPFFDAAKVIRHWSMRADEMLADELERQREAERAADSTGDAPGPDTDADGSAGDAGQAEVTDDSDATAGAANPPVTTSTLFLSSTIDDVRVLDGTFDAIDGAIIENELFRLAEEIRLADKRAGRERSAAQRRAAALVEMARRSAVSPADGRRPRPLLTVLVGERSLDRVCELSNGATISPAALVPYLGEAEIESVLFDGPSTIVAVSARRLFVGAVRRAVQVRDRRCRHPSECDVPADRCDVDHVVPHAQHGPTSQFNGRLLCPAHNRLAQLRDLAPQPLPERTLTRAEEARVKVRWRCRNDPDLWPSDHPDAGNDHDHDPLPDPSSTDPPDAPLLPIGDGCPWCADVADDDSP
jgi:hypothetical protein